MKIVIITGEESGDRLGAALMDSLKTLYKGDINSVSYTHLTLPTKRIV